MFSTKRAGTIVSVASYIVYLMGEIRCNPMIKNKKKVFRRIIFTFVLLCLILLAINQFWSLRIIDRLMKLKEDGGSGRISIWRDIIDHFEVSDSISRWFGHGYQSVYYQLVPYGKHRLAHNSYLEFLYDYGYIGLIIFLCFFIMVIKKTYQAFRRKSIHNVSMLIALLISVVFSCFSYFFEESKIIMPIAIFWGCVVGETNRTIHANDRFEN